MVKMQGTFATNRISAMRRNVAVLWMVIFTVAVFSFASTVFAQETLLTFQGQVTSVSGDASLAGSSSLYPNQTFDFAILISSAQAGTYVDANGVTQPITTLSDPSLPGFYENAFLVNFDSGNRIWNPAFAGNGAGNVNYGSSTTPIYTFPGDPFDPNSTISVTQAPWGALIMGGGSSDASWFFEVETTANTLSAADPRNWQVGETFNAINQATLNGQFSAVDGTVTLTGISPEISSAISSGVSPVPEPSSFALCSLAFGLIAIVRAIRKSFLLRSTDKSGCF